MSIYLQKSASIQPRASPPEFQVLYPARKCSFVLQSVRRRDRRPEPDRRPLGPLGPHDRVRGLQSSEMSASLRKYGFFCEKTFFSNLCQILQILDGSFSAVPKPTFSNEFSCCSIFRALQDLRTFAPLCMFVHFFVGISGRFVQVVPLESPTSAPL